MFCGSWGTSVAGAAVGCWTVVGNVSFCWQAVITRAAQRTSARQSIRFFHMIHSSILIRSSVYHSDGYSVSFVPASSGYRG